MHDNRFYQAFNDDHPRPSKMVQNIKKETRQVTGELIDPATIETKIINVSEDDLQNLPPILLGRATPAVQREVMSFYGSVALMFEAWINSFEKSRHTQRTYRQGVMSFVGFQGITWPDESAELLKAAVLDVQDWRKQLGKEKKAPKTINSYTSSVGSFFKFMQATAGDRRLPIIIGNPAHAQFIKRDSNKPVKDTESLTLSELRQLLAMPEGDDAIALRDRAILKFYYLSGCRIATGCALNVSDFNDHGEVASYRAKLKGGDTKRKGLHVVAAQAIREYLDGGGITRGAVFRSRVSGKGRILSRRRMDESTMYRLLMGYLERLPGAMVEEEVEGEVGEKRVVKKCRLSPHTLRATFVTLNPAELEVVQEQVDHKNIQTTRGYRKKKIDVAAGASHEAPL